MIQIDILNASELASRESKAARMMAPLVPEMIKRKVEEEVARKLKEEFTKMGVQAQITVCK